MMVNDIDEEETGTVLATRHLARLVEYIARLSPVALDVGSDAVAPNGEKLSVDEMTEVNHVRVFLPDVRRVRLERNDRGPFPPVSYTHLTLPTIYSV